MFCGACGAPVPEGAKFCRNCGAPLAGRSQAGAAPAVGAAPAASQPQPQAQPRSQAQPQQQPPAPSQAQSQGFNQAAAPSAYPAASPGQAATPSQASAPARPSPAVRALKFVGRLLATVAVAVALALCIRTFVLQAYMVPSASMSDTIEQGDYILAEKISYLLGEPEAGDIVVFTVYGEFVDATTDIFGQVTSGEPQSDTIAVSEEDVVTQYGGEVLETTLVKRVIATAGQTVVIKDGVVYVDGPALDESYTDGKETSVSATDGTWASDYVDEDGVFTYIVQEDEVFVLGDNRTDSADSRVFGPVPVSNIQGRVVLCYWPSDHAGTVE